MQSVASQNNQILWVRNDGDQDLRVALYHSNEKSWIVTAGEIQKLCFEPTEDVKYIGCSTNLDANTSYTYHKYSLEHPTTKERPLVISHDFTPYHDLERFNYQAHICNTGVSFVAVRIYRLVAGTYFAASQMTIIPPHTDLELPYKSREEYSTFIHYTTLDHTSYLPDKHPPNNWAIEITDRIPRKNEPQFEHSSYIIDLSSRTERAWQSVQHTLNLTRHTLSGMHLDQELIEEINKKEIAEIKRLQSIRPEKVTYGKENIPISAEEKQFLKNQGHETRIGLCSSGGGLRAFIVTSALMEVFEELPISIHSGASGSTWAMGRKLALAAEGRKDQYFCQSIGPAICRGILYDYPLDESKEYIARATLEKRERKTGLLHKWGLGLNNVILHGIDPKWKNSPLAAFEEIQQKNKQPLMIFSSMESHRHYHLIYQDRYKRTVGNYLVQHYDAKIEKTVFDETYLQDSAHSGAFSWRRPAAHSGLKHNGLTITPSLTTELATCGSAFSIDHKTAANTTDPTINKMLAITKWLPDIVGVASWLFEDDLENCSKRVWEKENVTIANDELSFVIPVKGGGLNGARVSKPDLKTDLKHPEEGHRRDLGIFYNLPLLPLMRKEREIEIIIINDTSETENIGDELKKAIQDVKSYGYKVPEIPDGLLNQKKAAIVIGDPTDLSTVCFIYMPTIPLDDLPNGINTPYDPMSWETMKLQGNHKELKHLYHYSKERCKLALPIIKEAIKQRQQAKTRPLTKAINTATAIFSWCLALLGG